MGLTICHKYVELLWLIMKTNVGLHGSVNGRAVPFQVWTGPEGSRRLRFPDFKTVGK
jgi:hypothetical protein